LRISLGNKSLLQELNIGTTTGDGNEVRTTADHLKPFGNPNLFNQQANQKLRLMRVTDVAAAYCRQVVS
jgi:hypothetical protein